MKRYWIAGVVVALLVVAGYFARNAAPGQTPAGQPAMVEIKSTSLDAIKIEFNRASDSIRVIALLSPT